MKPRVPLLFIFAALTLISFSNPLRADEAVELASAVNATGLDLYRVQASQADGNLLLSPYAIESVGDRRLG